MPEAFDVVIYHNPACGTSRNTLAMIRNAGIEPTSIRGSRVTAGNATAAQVAALFETSFETLHHEASGLSVVRAGAFALPAHIDDARANACCAFSNRGH